MFELLKSVLADRKITAREAKQIRQSGALGGDILRLARSRPKQALASLKADLADRQPLDAQVAPGDGLISFGDLASQGQGLLGTCAPLAIALDNVSYQVNSDQTWTFKFAGQLVTVPGSRDITGATGELGVLERAYSALARKTGSYEKTKTPWQEITDGNSSELVIGNITGRSASVVWVGTKGFAEMDSALAKGQTVILSDFGQPRPGGIVPTHAYRVTGSKDNYTLWNPWGNSEFSKNSPITGATQSWISSNFDNGTITYG